MKKILLVLFLIFYSNISFAVNDFRSVDFSRNTEYNTIVKSLISSGFKQTTPFIFSAPRYESPLEEVILTVSENNVEKINYKFNNFQQKTGILNYLMKKYGQKNHWKYEDNDFNKDVHYYEWLENNKYIFFSFDSKNKKYEVFILPYNIYNNK